MYALVDEELESQFADPVARTQWLILDRHPDFAGHWIVEGFNTEYVHDVGHIVGPYRALAPSGLRDFFDVARAQGYRVAFFDDPAGALAQFEHLNAEPEVEVNSTFANTVKGMLPYQVQGFNWLKELDYGVARWDTGCGKTVLAAALTKYHGYKGNYDLCFFVVKKNNKVNTVRKLKRLVGVEAICVSGLRPKRQGLYDMVRSRINEGDPAVLVLNYEQFKTDFTHRDDDGKLQLSEWGEAFFPGRDLLFIWDEMPVKLKTRTSELYKAICKCLYRTAPPQVNHKRMVPRSMRAYMLSATPIENSPEDWANCVRLLDGGATYGTVADFEDTYVKSWNFYDPDKPYEFHNFERMRLKAAHFVHQVSKSDPDIAAVFPRAVEEPIYIDWDERNAALYNRIQDQARGETEGKEFADVPIFSLIGTLQMMCDAPEMIRDSAARREVYEDALVAWTEAPIGREPQRDGSEFAMAVAETLADRLTNKGHPKLEKLRELLLERHPNDQVVVYSKLNYTLLPYLEAALRDWGVAYGRYTGTERQQQAIQDAFQAGEIRVFLASDSGSDSIDLDAGNVVIDYNLPWKWTTLTQRHNRVHRPTSEHETVYYYSLIMEGSIEERVLQIIERKKGYHNQLFDPAAGDLSASARLTKEELMYVLTGEGA